jgi:chromosomal replication initiation ATPase DnaA
MLCGCGRDFLSVALDDQGCTNPLEVVSRPTDASLPSLPARVQLIIAEVSETYKVKPRSLLRHAPTGSPECTAALAAMRLTREITGMHFEEIGRCFHRHHSTVISACRTAEVSDDLRDSLQWVAA